MKFMTLVFTVLLLMLASCTSIQTTQDQPSVSSPRDSVQAETRAVSIERISLNWENTTEPHPERKPWSDHLVVLIKENLEKFKTGTDWSEICPKWTSLSDQQKVHVIGTMIVATVYYESEYNPLSRMREKSLSGVKNPVDPITKTYVYSEGLLQLSYQDMQWAPWCKFDWSKDKLLRADDPQKTILDPYLNLSCGVPIMANQISKKGKVFPPSGYWAVQNTSSSYSQVANIKARILKYAPQCK